LILKPLTLHRLIKVGPKAETHWKGVLGETTTPAELASGRRQFVYLPDWPTTRRRLLTSWGARQATEFLEHQKWVEVDMPKLVLASIDALQVDDGL
jgi:hypothetical protein